MNKYLCLFAAVIAVAMCGIYPSQAQTNLAVEASLTQLHAEARVKASAAKIAAARMTLVERDQALQLFSTAFSLAQQQDYKSARVAFQRGLAIDPSNGQAEYFLAETLIQLGDLAGAMPHYALAQALTPDSVEGIKAEVALTEGATSLVTPLQIGQAWNLHYSDRDGDTYDGVLNITARVDGNHFTGSLQIHRNNLAFSQFDESLLLDGSTLTIRSTGGATYELSSFNLDQWRGAARGKGNQGVFASDVVMKKN